MYLPDLKKYAYNSLNGQSSVVNVEARFNVMQTVFVVMQSYTTHCKSCPSEDVVADTQKILQRLLDLFFTEELQVTPVCVVTMCDMHHFSNVCSC